MVIFLSQIVYCEDDFHSPTASTSPPASPSFHLQPRRRRKTSSGTRHKDEEGEITIECQRLNREHQLEKVGCTSFKHLIQTLISSPVYPTICELLFPGCSLCIWVGVSCSCRQKSWTAAKPASKDAESTGDYWNDPCSCCLLFFWSTTLHFCQKPQGIFPACHFHLHFQNDLFCFLAKKKLNLCSQISRRRVSPWKNQSARLDRHCGQFSVTAFVAFTRLLHQHWVFVYFLCECHIWYPSTPCFSKI